MHYNLLSRTGQNNSNNLCVFKTHGIYGRSLFNDLSRMYRQHTICIMEHDFWHQRWQDDKLGFHLPEANPLLVQYASRLNLSPGDEVFVPLCGKTLDMTWLREQGYDVVGIELSKIALEAFFKENEIGYRELQAGDFSVYHSLGYTLYGGDFFALNAAALQSCKVVYDRAALVAFPPEMRQRYVQHLKYITPANCPILLITLEYNEGEMDGPPFSLPFEEVVELYGDTFNIEPLHEDDGLQTHPEMQERGLGALRESVLLLTPKD